MLTALLDAGAEAQAAALATRMALENAVARPDTVASLLEGLAAVGFPDQRRMLLARDPIAFPTGLSALFMLKQSVPRLLGVLAAQGATVLVERFAARLAADTTLGRKATRSIALQLLDLGMTDRAVDMLDSLADSGWYWGRDYPAGRRRNPHGREPDGTSSPAWTWHDL